MVTHKEQEIFTQKSISLYIYSDRNISTYCYRHLQRDYVYHLCWFVELGFYFDLLCLRIWIHIYFFKFFPHLCRFLNTEKRYVQNTEIYPFILQNISRTTTFLLVSICHKPHRRNFSSHCRNSFFACYIQIKLQKK